MIIKGNTVGTTMPRANFNQTDEKKADYILGREKILPKSELDSAINSALTTAKESGAFDGKDGYTPVKGKDYFDGRDGKDGKDGYTPIKGKDYVDGQNGKDGYTPIKGVDYFDGKDGTNGTDGKDGKTPVKGTDYFTPADVSEMVQAVVNALPVYDGEVIAE